ncbi:hypothetical protein FCIRC_6787 [Fusarium circinatum]|uniref:Uncharacterized protein n=1 Tax=Fusarium circinatum TaxID=48490 RepID=A0A8H5X0W3_FUSCI|nr:hypothetical protein FCIRC_6787 [Fusarium circinatum]
MWSPYLCSEAIEEPKLTETGHIKMSSEWKPGYQKEDDGAPVYDKKEELPGPAYEDNSAGVVFEGGGDSGSGWNTDEANESLSASSYSSGSSS